MSNNKLSIFNFEHENTLLSSTSTKIVIACGTEDIIESNLYIGYYKKCPLISQRVKDKYNINDYIPNHYGGIDWGSEWIKKNISEFKYSDLIFEYNKLIELYEYSRYVDQCRIKQLKDLLELIMINWNE
jgi:hypothetical protein